MISIKQSLEYHSELDQKLWDKTRLRNEVRTHLLKIADLWKTYAKIPDAAIHDIVLTGSAANFNYSPNSDIDVHFLIDTSMLPISDPTILQDYMKSKKDMWAANHDIYVKGYPVELYAQNVNEHIPTQQGVYSLKNNKWLIEPENLHLDWEHDFGLRTKVHEQMRKIDSVVNNNESIEQAKAVRDHITKLRGESIQKAGEFSIPNLIFKALRNNGYLDKITKYIREREDKQLSLESVEHGLKFKVDNPGGDWLKYKQEDAEERMRKYGHSDTHLGKGMTGSITGYYNKPVHIPVKHIQNLPGATGEEKFRDTGTKQKSLEKEVGHPDNFDTKKHPIFIGVNHLGHGYVMEGNHRLAYAKKHGISHIHAEVRYYNGGEDAEGPLHPDKLKQLHKE